MGRLRRRLRAEAGRRSASNRASCARQCRSAPAEYAVQNQVGPSRKLRRPALPARRTRPAVEARAAKTQHAPPSVALARTAALPPQSAGIFPDACGTASTCIPSPTRKPPPPAPPWLLRTAPESAVLHGFVSSPFQGGIDRGRNHVRRLEQLFDYAGLPAMTR